MAERYGAGTRSLLGLPEPDPIEVERKHREYLASELKRLNEIIERYRESAMPQLWREVRASDEQHHASKKARNTVLAWVAAKKLKTYVEEDQLGDEVWRKNRPVLDRVLADLATEIAPDAADAYRNADVRSATLPKATKAAGSKREKKTVKKRKFIQVAARKLRWRCSDYRAMCRALADDKKLYRKLTGSPKWPKPESRRKEIRRHYSRADHDKIRTFRLPLAAD